MTRSQSPEPAYRCDAAVGESPLWDDRDGRLLWVDIPAGRLFRGAPDGGVEERAVGAPLGAIGRRGKHELVAAGAGGFGIIEPDEGRLELVHPVCQMPDERMNDAKCDPAGRFWGGSTLDGRRPGGGRLLCWDHGRGDVRAVWEGLELPNGLGWSPDGRTFYLADSHTRRLYAADFDPSSGAMGRRRVLIAFTASDGLPDGLCVDADGCLWLAMWGAGKVVRLAPDGRALGVIAMPVSQPSSCALAPDGTLFVTSARAGLDPVRLRSEPYAGSVLAVAAGVEPVPVPAFPG